MNPELKAKWVAALRSGEYTQAKGILKSANGGYCCLGVLREVAGHEVLPEAEDEFLLERENAEAIGIGYGIQKKLSEMNDGNRTSEVRQHNFTEIADYIEDNL